LEKIIGTGITFDDVLLVPAKSSVHPSEASTATQLTKTIRLNIPIISAAMDTVTEYELAIALAREGGIGIIHKNMAPERQASQVDRVKRSESGIISNPITLEPGQLVRDAVTVMRKYKISGVPITDKGKLVGMVTTRDLRFVDDDSLLIQQVMTKDNLITAREGVSMEEAKGILHKHRIEKLPVVDTKMRIKGLITFKDIKKKMDFPMACKDTEGRLRVGAAVGVGADALKRVDLLVESNVDLITIDTAHGHSQNVLDALTKIKTRHRKLQVVAGNVATARAATDLIKSGADCIKDMYDAGGRRHRGATDHGYQGLRARGLKSQRSRDRRWRHQIQRRYHQSYCRGG
jgi:IMP dehydrogenase